MVHGAACKLYGREGTGQFTVCRPSARICLWKSSHSQRDHIKLRMDGPRSSSKIHLDCSQATLMSCMGCDGCQWLRYLHVAGGGISPCSSSRGQYCFRLSVLAGSGSFQGFHLALSIMTNTPRTSFGGTLYPVPHCQRPLWVQAFWLPRRHRCLL